MFCDIGIYFQLKLAITGTGQGREYIEISSRIEFKFLHVLIAKAFKILSI